MDILYAALAASLLGNLLLLGLFLLMRREADNARHHADAMAREYMHLRSISHRRDPETGRLLPLGK